MRYPVGHVKKRKDGRNWQYCTMHGKKTEMLEKIERKYGKSV